MTNVMTDRELIADLGRDIASRDQELRRLRAVNAKLVEACERAAGYMPCGEPSKGNGCIEPEGWGDAISQLNEALAAAKEADGG